jgi:iron complex outermembrane receptor protein
MRPAKKLEYFAEATTGSYDRGDFKGSVSGPLASWLRVRATAAYIRRDGYIKRLDIMGNDTGLRDGNQNRLIGRLVADMDLAHNLTATLAVDGTHMRERSAGGVQVDVNNGAGTFASYFNAAVPGGCSSAAATGTVPYCYTSRYVQPLKSLQTYSQYQSRSAVDVWGAAFTLDWQLGNAGLKSISAYRKVSADLAHDLSGSPYYVNAIQQAISTEQFSEELQLTGKAISDRLNYTFGLFYLKETGTQVSRSTIRRCSSIPAE